MKFLKFLTMFLLVVGGLNWGLVGAFDFNLVTKLLGEGSMLTRLVYILVGLAAVAKLFCCKKCCSSTGEKR